MAFVDGQGREALDEGEEEAVERLGPERALEVGERPGEGAGLGSLAEKPRHVVEYLVDEGHRIEPAGPDRPLGQEGGVDLFVYPPGEEPRGPEIREYHVARASEQASFHAELGRARRGRRGIP